MQVSVSVSAPRRTSVRSLSIRRQRYRHLLDAPADHGAHEHAVIDDNIVPVVLERQAPLLLTASPAPILASPPKPGQVCKIIIGCARLKLSGNLTPAMPATLVRELKKGRR